MKGQTWCPSGHYQAKLESPCCIILCQVCSLALLKGHKFMCMQYALTFKLNTPLIRSLSQVYALTLSF